MHPALPHPAVVEAYYKDYVEQYPSLLRAAWGFTVETATQGLRLVLSGVFDAYPRLKIILGHMGEGLPFYLWRISMGLARDGRGGKSFRDVFCEHFYITTSGFFSDPALLCCMMEMGIDRILFSVDYPFVDNPPGTKWTETLPLCRRGQGETTERQRQAAVEAVESPRAPAQDAASASSCSTWPRLRRWATIAVCSWARSVGEWAAR